MSENQTTKVKKSLFKKKKKSRTNREGSTSNSESAEPAGTSLEPSTLDFEGAGAFEENNPVHPVQQEEMDSDDEKEPVAAESAVNLCSPAPAEEQTQPTVKERVQVLEGSSGSSSSSTEVRMEGITTGQGGNKTFDLEG